MYLLLNYPAYQGEHGVMASPMPWIPIEPPANAYPTGLSWMESVMKPARACIGPRAQTPVLYVQLVYSWPLKR